MPTACAYAMSNTVAVILGILIVGLIVTDLVVAQTGATLFLATQLTELVEYLSFWR